MSSSASLPARFGHRVKANVDNHSQAYNVPSPNEMVVDSADFGADKEPVAIISPDNVEQEADQLQDLPLANDCMSLKTVSHAHCEETRLRTIRGER